MLALALRCASINDALMKFIDQENDEKLGERIRGAVGFFKSPLKGLTLNYEQLVIFGEQCKQYKENHKRDLYWDLLILLNPHVALNTKKETASRVLQFFSLLNELCLYHFSCGTHFGPPSSFPRGMAQKCQ